MSTVPLFGNGKKWWQAIVLGVVAFSVLVLLLRVYGVLSPVPDGGTIVDFFTLRIDDSTEKPSPKFIKTIRRDVPAIAAINRSDQRIIVKEGSAPNSPRVIQTNSSLLLSGWFRLNELPKLNSRMMLFQKYDKSDSEYHPGIAAAVSKESDGLRMSVYWRGQEGEGRWFSFSQIPVEVKEWFLLTLVYHHEENVLAALVGTSSSMAVNCGAYPLEDRASILSDEPLYIGATGSKTFRGKIGPFAIAHGFIDVQSALALHRARFMQPGDSFSDLIAVRGLSNKISVALDLAGGGENRAQFPLAVSASGNAMKVKKRGGSSTRAVSRERRNTIDSDSAEVAESIESIKNAKGEPISTDASDGGTQ